MSTRIELLLGRAERTFGSVPINEAIGSVRAIIGLPNVPESEKAAQTALDKLQGKDKTGRPTASELAALEFVIRMMRPAPRSLNGQFEALPAQKGSNVYQPAFAQAWENFREKSKRIIYSFGRIDRNVGGTLQIGTGFLVDEDLVLTNHHVLSTLSHGADELEAGMAVIRFYQEYEGPEPEPACPITKVIAIHPTLDIALLQIKNPQSRPILQFSMAPISAHVTVATLGYPFQDERNPLFVNAIYQGQYGIKRGAVGEVMGTAGPILSHDCSTLGGNSGSPVLALDTLEVVGLHFTGEFMYRNGAVAAADLAEFVKEVNHNG